MNLYSVKLESFHINTTRSRHNDTDTVTLGAQIGNTLLPVLSFGSGDVNDGDHGVGLHFASMLLTDPDRILGFSYTIYNGSVGELSTNLNQLATSLVTKGVQMTVKGPTVSFINLSGGVTAGGISASGGLTSLLANTSSWYVAVGKVLAEAAINFLFPNCDGFVAGDVVSMTHQQWDEAIDGQGGSVFRATMTYPGTDSPGGCGGNSSYTVTWSVTRERVTGSLKRFLRARGRSGAEGLRMLVRTAVTV